MNWAAAVLFGAILGNGVSAAQGSSAFAASPATTSSLQSPAVERQGGAAPSPAPVRPPVIPAADLRMPYVPAAEPNPPGEAYGRVSGVALNSKGHLFVYQRTQKALIEYDRKGAFVRTYGDVVQTRAHSVRIDSADNIWLVDVGAQTVTKLSPNGQVLMTLGSKGQKGTWDDARGVRLFNEPNDIAFGRDGDFFVSTGDHGAEDPRVVHFDKAGRFMNTWSLAPADGSTTLIHSIVVGPGGNVYVADREVMKLKVFKPDGTPVKEIQMANLVCGLFVSKQGELWMTSGRDGMIIRLGWDGSVRGWTGKAGEGPNEYGEAHYMALSDDLSTIYVSDPLHQRIQKVVRP